jgi:hypothetical protein
MATWNVGPFDNDDAVEWCDRFNAAEPARHTELVQATLGQAFPNATNLTEAAAAEVVAAAAVVLQARTGMPDASTPYAPRFVVNAEQIDVTPELLRLAWIAMRAIIHEESSWRLRWADSVEGELALEVMERLHLALGNADD